MSTPTHRVLFVCMGNICRSPAAEIIFHQMIERAGLAEKFNIDSAGTIGMHQGNAPDPRMRRALRERGYTVFGAARKITPADLQDFDLILVMDDDNEAHVRAADRQRMHGSKIRKLTSYLRHHQADEVPDPYYGGDEGFSHVIDLLEDACAGLLTTLEPDHKLS